VDWYVVTSIPEESAGSVFRLEAGKQDGGNTFVKSICIHKHGIMTQKSTISTDAGISTPVKNLI
jgi:hypothetical protein